MSTPAFRILEPRSSTDADVDRDFAVDVLVGLSSSPKKLNSRYFYDADGSRFFQQITDLQEYYPTAAEFEILRAHREAICAPLVTSGEPFNLVDLGAGDGRKTKVVLEHLHAIGAPVRYVPIDISQSAIEGLVADVQETFPGLECEGLVSEYLTGLDWLSQQGRRTLVLFLGSNIGNFDRTGSRHFLRRLWNALNADDLVLIGFDLKKDIDTLLRAYNDSEGVTKAFNLNLLKRINRELGANFDLEKFTHFSTYNVFSGAMESYLLSLDRQEVFVEELQRTFRFKPYEPIHTEYSFKYLDEDVLRMADETGFVVDERWWDAQHRFVDGLFRVVKGKRQPAAAATPRP